MNDKYVTMTTKTKIKFEGGFKQNIPQVIQSLKTLFPLHTKKTFSFLNVTKFGIT